MKLAVIRTKTSHLEEGIGKYVAAGTLAALPFMSGDINKLDDKRSNIQRQMHPEIKPKEQSRAMLPPEPFITKASQEDIPLIPHHMRMNELPLNDYAEFTEKWEGRGKPGREGYAYKDSLGVPTIGVGFNLMRNDAISKLKQLGITDIRAVLDGRLPLSQEQINALFYPDIEQAAIRARKYVPNFSEQPDQAKRILVDMTYQLYDLNRLPKFLMAIKNKKYKDAAKEAYASKWYKQSGDRSRHHVAVLFKLKP